jgi:hypothetical protein
VSASEGSPRTYAWARATSGALTAAEKKRMRSGVRAGYADFGLGLARWPIRRRPDATELPARPDSRLARVAEEAAIEQPPALTGHGYRTWVLGTALAQSDHVALDPELMYVTSLLHDSGMVREVAGEDFTVRSAETLIDVFGRANEPAERGLLAADAAVSHASPGLTADENPTGRYVQAGAMADLIGLRMWDLPRGLLAEAYRQHPSQRVHRVIAELIRREARDVPDGRFALLKRSGLDRMVVLSPTRRYART